LVSAQIFEIVNIAVTAPGGVLEKQDFGFLFAVRADVTLAEVDAAEQSSSDDQRLQG